MNGWSVPPVLMAGVTAFVSLHYALIWVRTRRSRDALTFAAMTAAMCLYDAASALLYSAAGPEEARPWQLLRGVSLGLWTIGLVLFVADYTRKPYGRFVKGACLVIGLLIAAGLPGGATLLYTHAPTSMTVDLPYGLSTTFHEVQEGPLAIALQLLCFGIYVHVFRAGFAYYRGGERNRAARLLAAAAVLFLGAANDLAVSAGEFRSVYVLEYAFLALVLLMSDSLSGELVRAGVVEEALRESERNYREVFNASSDAIFVHDEDGAIVDVNETMLDFYGCDRAEALSLRVGDFSSREAPYGPEPAAERLRRAREEGPQVFEWKGRRRDGREFWVEVALRWTRIAGKDRILAMVRNVDDRKAAEAAHRLAEERVQRLAEAAFEGIGITEDGRIVDANPPLARMLGYDVAEMIGRPVLDFVAPQSTDFVAGILEEERGDLIEHLAVRKDGTVFPIETQGRPLPSAGTNVRVAAVRDITERKRAEERIRGHLERLRGLRAIDECIIGGETLDRTVAVVLDLAIRLLEVDAARYLALDGSGTTLAVAAAQGFRAEADPAPFPVASAPAGWALAEGRSVHAALTELPAGRTVPEDLATEGFAGYHAAPLAAKGNVLGVLEFLERRPRPRDPAWTEFLEAVAGQLAIAVDSRHLFENLERSHADLAAAYDGTLAGWSRALELKDRETKGHSERVVDLTVRLAREMGVPEADIVHVRRGALLHDIGKMGIPDRILQKAGPLTEDEWEVMRQHPDLAVRLLSPVPHLAPALVIPYCHHERWDGTGYPRGLRGEEIPLPARAFSVADAWDALLYERPYREAWPAEKVKAYLLEQSGHRFDPAVVETFLRSIVAQASGAGR